MKGTDKQDPTKSLWRKALTLAPTPGGYSIIFYNGVKLGDALADVDGFYKFWAAPGEGFWEAYVLRCISECLDELNIPIEKDLAEYFGEEGPSEGD